MLVEHHEAVVVGAGIAGLTVALELGAAIVLTAAPLGAAGSTAWAKGGIAAAVGHGDSVRQHAADTIAVGAGLGDEQLAVALAEGGPAALRRLIAQGARFDSVGGELALGREAGHRTRRIVHAGGDATGAEVSRALAAAVSVAPGVEVVEAAAVDLARHESAVGGVVARHPDGRVVLHAAPAVVLATGGAGRVYARTTNPADVRGDGVAMAARAGARLADLEFVQFHPTALAADLDPMPLLSEALRGEGAQLVDDEGGRYLAGLHPDAELAPRDVVARATWQLLADGRKAYLDATMLDRFAARFPSAFAAAQEAGLDPAADLLPVSPAAHYFMGGVAADGRGRTSVPGLWVVGEAAATGLHGANRLASNSLLEGMVFGARVASAVRRERRPAPRRLEAPRIVEDGAPQPQLERRLREIMWRDVGVVRSEASLRRARDEIARMSPLDATVPGRNLRLVASSITEAALARRESRGAHFRSDHPAPAPGLAERRFRTPPPVPVEPVA